MRSSRSTRSSQPAAVELRISGENGETEMDLVADELLARKRSSRESRAGLLRAEQSIESIIESQSHHEISPLPFACLCNDEAAALPIVLSASASPGGTFDPVTWNKVRDEDAWLKVLPPVNPMLNRRHEKVPCSRLLN